MADSEHTASGEILEDSQPEYLEEVTDVKFQNISIKSYEKKSSTGIFPREEYYAFRIVSMYVGGESLSCDLHVSAGS